MIREEGAGNKTLVASWRSGFGLFKADAQKVADEITSIGESATPNQILDKARDEETELHKCFDWDNDSAAEKYRLYQARQIVHHLVCKEADEAEGERPAVRLFYKTDSSDGYKPTTFIMQDKGEYQKLLERAYAELKAFQRKYKTLTELDEVFYLIDQLAG